MKSGKGFLRQCVIYDPHSHGLIHSLCWQDVPLIRFWSEAGCPTCAEFVYSGFAEDEQEPPGFCLLSKTGIARGLAWYLPDSYLCVLLDGHHKATAAALEGRPLKTLVLSTATHFNDEQQTTVFRRGMSAQNRAAIPHTKTHRVQNITAQRMGEFRP